MLGIVLDNAVKIFLPPQNLLQVLRDKSDLRGSVVAVVLDVFKRNGAHFIYEINRVVGIGGDGFFQTFV